MDIQTASADFDKKLLAHLTNMIGKPTPTSRELAAALDVGRGTIEASFYRLVRQGLVSASGTGNYRTISIKGVGDTLPRLSKADRIAANVEFEPVRVEATSCPRCGARNCQRHSAAFLTSAARLPGYMAA